MRAVTEDEHASKVICSFARIARSHVLRPPHDADDKHRVPRHFALHRENEKLWSRLRSSSKASRGTRIGYREKSIVFRSKASIALGILSARIVSHVGLLDRED